MNPWAKADRSSSTKLQLAAAICRRVPPTKTEKAMRRRLAEMREAEAEALVNDAE